MKSFLPTTCAFICLFILTGCPCDSTDEEAAETPVFKGPYLGLEPPGDVPKLFAPGVVADVFREHSGAVFSPDGNELFWTTIVNPGQSPQCFIVLHMEQVDEVWHGPELADFSTALRTHINSISPDGKRIYLMTDRTPEAGFDPEVINNVWIVEKTETGWDKFHMDPVLNTPENKMTDVQEARSGNRYGFGSLDGVEDWRGLLVSKLVDGEYQAPEPIWPELNNESLDHSISIDPDERYFVFASSRREGFSEQDLFISYRQPVGTWGAPINLGEKINSAGESQGWPHLSPDGKYLFFTASTSPYKDIVENPLTYAEIREITSSIRNGWSNIYWVDTSFVDRLRPSEE